MIRALLFFSAAAWGQIAGPLLGWVPDGDRIRPIYGIPASAAVGHSIRGGRDLRLIAVSPRQDYVLATAANSGEALVITGGDHSAPIRGVAAGADRIVLSPTGSAAALWFSATNRIQILSGLPAAPKVRELDATFLASPPLALAVSDDAQWLAGAWPNGLYTWGPDGAVNQPQVEAGVVALTFFHQRADLALATATRVFSLIDNRVSMIFGSDDQPLSPVGLALSFDNRQLVLAGRSGVLVIDPTTGLASTIDCGCAPEGIFGMGGSLFRLTSGVVKLLDAAAGSIWFAPPALDAGVRR